MVKRNDEVNTISDRVKVRNAEIGLISVRLNRLSPNPNPKRD